ncbi:MAG TPA: type III pantothenate kinase [Longimicrobiales bacterium]|nr:type III pantothenate kinase [Longimicrobiales bacterium]
MKLVVDVGNTETVMGVVDDARTTVASWRVSTQVPRTPDEYGHLLRSLLREAGFGSDQLDVAVVGSVVPSATEVLIPTLRRLTGRDPILIDPESPLPVRLEVDEPRTVGADRIVNTLAACELYGRDTIIVDLGTATTYDLVTADGAFMGGVIAPGVSAGLEWLSRRTAKLPSVGLSRPERVIGTRTDACIRSGIFYGIVDALEGMVGRIREEWGRGDVLVVATGGYAEVVGPHAPSIDEIAPFLTLTGLAIAGEILAD